MYIKLFREKHPPFGKKILFLKVVVNIKFCKYYNDTRSIKVCKTTFYRLNYEKLNGSSKG